MRAKVVGALLATSSSAIYVAACAGTSTNAPPLALDAAADVVAPNALDGGGSSGDLASEAIGALTSAKTILWIAAHPDDEVYVSPILARACGTSGSGPRCHFLVLTRGEGGSCKLPGGCSPDLATVRDGELRASASLFDAALTQWDLGDVGDSPDDVATAWTSRAGGPQALIDRVGAFITAIKPDVLVTFDPRNGGTCHPAHRTAAALALRAASASMKASETFVTASRNALVMGTDGRITSFGFVPYVVGDTRVRVVDATKSLPNRTGTGWDWLEKAMAAHPSQFVDVLDVVHAALPEQRVIHLLRGDDITDDARYGCP